MALPKARHDALFRLLVSDPGRAGKLLRDYLPPEVVARLDPERPPEHVEGTAIDGEGSRTQSDGIFRVHLADGGRVVAFVLLEHRSQVDHRTPLQLVRHVLSVWAMEMDGGAVPDGGLPPIIPMVILHDGGACTAPCTIQEMIHAPKWLNHLVRYFGHHVLHELGRTAPQDPSLGAEVRTALLALACTFRDRISDAEADRLAAGVVGTGFGHYILAYTIEHVTLPPERIRAALKRTGTDPAKVEEIMGTAAQIWMEQGKAAGIVEGKADTFLRQARLKFGELSSAQAEQVRNASTEQLDSWLEALLTARDIDGVLGESARH